MAAGPQTQISDVIVPERFTAYVQQLTETKSRLIQSGALATNELLSGLLAGGGITFQVPSFRDLDDDEENISTDAVPDRLALTAAGDVSTFGAATFEDSTPNKIQTSVETAVRLSRNNSWASADLAAALAGEDPMAAIAGRVSDYWARSLQRAMIATMNGVIADNVANDSGDYQNDISGASFTDGVTNFSAEAFIDTTVTAGDSMEDFTVLMVHSIVYARMQKNNLIDFIPDARGEVNIPTFQGRIVIVDDGMPASGGVFDSWLFGPGAVQLGVGSAKVPTEMERNASGGNGGGSETLFSRVEWTLHPVGHAYSGTPANGGPSNASTANNLAAATSWNRVYPERKQIKFARLVTREF
jgi:hypothetical protein